MQWQTLADSEAKDDRKRKGVTEHSGTTTSLCFESLRERQAYTTLVKTALPVVLSLAYTDCPFQNQRREVLSSPDPLTFFFSWASVNGPVLERACHTLPAVSPTWLFMSIVLVKLLQNWIGSSAPLRGT
jgi:hypothetical protein